MAGLQCCHHQGPAPNTIVKVNKKLFPTEFGCFGSPKLPKLAEAACGPPKTKIISEGAAGGDVNHRDLHSTAWGSLGDQS